jgi:metallo-beta-lactamase family protein
MCTGGRVRYHLRHNLGRNNCAVVFVGYAARGHLQATAVEMPALHQQFML